MNEESRPARRLPEPNITGAEHTAWPRCCECGRRAPTAEFLVKHRLRRCPGPVEGRHVVARRLTVTERAAFVSMLRERSA